MAITILQVVVWLADIILSVVVLKLRTKANSLSVNMDLRQNLAETKSLNTQPMDKSKTLLEYQPR